MLVTVATSHRGDCTAHHYDDLRAWGVLAGALRGAVKRQIMPVPSRRAKGEVCGGKIGDELALGR